MTFPEDFIWATASSAYQQEGAESKDGRGQSVWDVLRREPNRILDNSPPDQSVDGYDHWKEDIQLIKQLGVSHYRFSLSWSRILPYGVDDVINEKGVQFYRNFIQELLDNGIQPIVTLFHADWPLRLYKNHSWLNDRSVDWFTDFARVCFEKFGDLVKWWITFNEVHMHAWSGITEFTGEVFHGLTDVFEKDEINIPIIATYKMLAAHTSAYNLYKKHFFDKQQGKIGIVAGGHWAIGTEDPEATVRAIEWMMDSGISPIFGDGDYPKSVQEYPMESNYLPDKKFLGSADFLGINYYRPTRIGEGVGTTVEQKAGKFKIIEDKSWERISGDDFWVVNVPEALKDLLVYVKENYGNIPVLITENGCADVDKEGTLEDDNRCRYIQQHVKAVEQAISEDCNVIGYTAWSLMDNFEWTDGFARRFGLYNVDYTTTGKKRTAKKSVQVYRSIIQEHRK